MIKSFVIVIILVLSLIQYETLGRAYTFHTLLIPLSFVLIYVASILKLYFKNDKPNWMILTIGLIAPLLMYFSMDEKDFLIPSLLVLVIEVIFIIKDTFLGNKKEIKKFSTRNLKVFIPYLTLFSILYSPLGSLGTKNFKNWRIDSLEKKCWESVKKGEEDHFRLIGCNYRGRGIINKQLKPWYLDF